MTKKERYRAYLKSDHWFNLRAECFSIARHRCEVCGSTRALQGHHLRYRKWYDCVPGDIMVLCGFHHELWHEHRTMRKCSREEAFRFFSNPIGERTRKKKLPRNRGSALQDMLMGFPWFAQAAASMEYEEFKEWRKDKCPKGVARTSFMHNSMLIYHDLHS